MVRQPAMPGREAESGTSRLRRARRDDIGALLDHVGGPPAGRLRALRRILKTLVADVYVLDEGAALLGAVVVTYRRSVARGGLVATVDLLRPLEACPPARHADVSARLAACAVHRARRRGCVALDSPLDEPGAVAALEAVGLVAVARQRVLPLRTADPEASTAASARRGDA